MLVFAIITGLVLFEVALQSTNVYSLYIDRIEYSSAMDFAYK